MQTTNNHHQPGQTSSWTQDPSMYSWASPNGTSPHPVDSGSAAGGSEPAGEKPPAAQAQSDTAAEPRPEVGEEPPRVPDPSPVGGPAPRRPEAVAPRSVPSPPAAPPAAAAKPAPQPQSPPRALDQSLVRPQREVPQDGWRRMIYQASFGLITPRISPAEVMRREWIGNAKRNVPGATSITVASMKGGVGKTTVSALLGLTLAQYRGDRAVAIDANPDAGTLADRLLGVGSTRPTIRDLLNSLDEVEAGTQLNRYLGLAGRLAVLASELDPAKSEMFNQDEYEAVACLIARFYDVLITDSGTGLVHSAMHGALNLTDGLVIVGAPTVDAANSAGRTLDWLAEHGFQGLVENAVVAISLDRETPDVDSGAIRDHFAERCRAVVEIPADPHLRTGGQIDLRALQQPTLDAALELASHVAEGFHHHSSSTLMKKAGLA